MLQEIFIQFGIIIFPICVYQIYAFGTSSDHLPFKAWVMGIYGGVSAILCQIMPLHIFGHHGIFQCVPIILSILYGKRKAGAIAITILSAYQFYDLSPQYWLPAIAAILVYSVIPLVWCYRFDGYNKRERFLIANLLSVITIILQLLFLVVYFVILYGEHGFDELISYSNFLAVSIVVQLAIMAVAFFLLEHIIEIGRLRNRLDSLIKHSPLGIAAFHMNNRFAALNLAYEEISGYKEAELLGKPWSQLWFDEEPDFAQNHIDSLLQGEIKRNREVDLKHKNGHPVPVQCTIVPMREDHQLVGYYAILDDLSEEKKAEEALRSSEKLSAIGQLAAGVAHEIRNPLTAIKGFIQLLSQSAAPAQSNHYDIIKSELNRIESIISEMLVLAKPNTLAFRPVSVKEKLKEVVNLLIGEANMQGVEVQAEFHEDDPMILGDGNQLKQVFLNMVKNAIEAMPNGGFLTISLSQAEQIQVTFTDTGVGIPEHLLSRIGEPFFSTKEKGTGLGLLVSSRIIASHNGSLHIQSVPGEGTQISMSFPPYSGS